MPQLRAKRWHVVATLTAALSLSAAAALAAGTSGPPPVADRTWAGTWASSPQALSQTSFGNQTLRLIVQTSFGWVARCGVGERRIVSGPAS